MSVSATDPFGFASLAGQTAVVTGASSGIGAEVSRTLARLGLQVLLVGRDAERLDEVRREIAESGGKADVAPCDITSDEAPATILEAALALADSVTILVHSAGIFEVKPYRDAPISDLDRAYALNVRAPYAITQELLPHLGDPSSVVFIGSNLSQFALPGTAAYSATKGAVEAMARTLSIELVPSGIHVNVVAPGTVRTPMTAALTSDAAAITAENARTPVGRIGEPEEIAAAVTYLCSPLARFVVGTTLIVDGGVCAR